MQLTVKKKVKLLHLKTTFLVIAVQIKMKFSLFVSLHMHSL